MPEGKLPYQWKVELRDGTAIVQHNEDGTTNKWPVDQIEDIKQMMWIPTDPESNLKSFDRIVLDGEKAVQFFRKKVPVEGGRKFCTYVFGVEKEDAYGEIERDLTFISAPFNVKINWPGSVQCTKDPKFVSAYEDFVHKNVCLFEELEE